MLGSSRLYAQALWESPAMTTGLLLLLKIWWSCIPVNFTQSIINKLANVAYSLGWEPQERLHNLVSIALHKKQMLPWSWIRISK